MTVAGLAAYPDRDAVAATLAPPAGAAARAMDEAIERASVRAQALMDRARRAGRQPAAAGGQPGPQGGAGSDRASTAAAGGSPSEDQDRLAGGQPGPPCRS